MNFFEVGLKYSMINEKGTEVKKSELYLVDALTFTECEARINKEMEPYLNDEFQISSMKRANYTELLEDLNGDRYYKCKVEFTTLDEEVGKEKVVSNIILVQASNLDHALENLKEGFKDMTVDWESTAITETKIMDVFKYFDQEEKPPVGFKKIESNLEGIEAYREKLKESDPLFLDAAKLVVENQNASTSLVQRHFQMGYNRAGRIFDQLEEKGIVGAFTGAKTRDVLISDVRSLLNHIEGLVELPFES